MPTSPEVLTLSLGPLQANCFLVIGDDVALVIDPGDEADVVERALAERAATPVAILVTHGHFDHFGGVAPLARRYEVPVYVGEPDVAQIVDPDLGPFGGFEIESVAECTPLTGESELDLGMKVTAIPTPGHSLGAYSFIIADHLFAGDVLFRGSIGRTDLPGGSTDQLLNSIAALVRRFPPDMIVHCGHGPDTTLGRELALNPFLAPLRHDPEYRW